MFKKDYTEVIDTTRTFKYQLTNDSIIEFLNWLKNCNENPNVEVYNQKESKNFCGKTSHLKWLEHPLEYYDSIRIKFDYDNVYIFYAVELDDEYNVLDCRINIETIDPDFDLATFFKAKSDEKYIPQLKDEPESSPAKKINFSSDRPKFTYHNTFCCDLHGHDIDVDRYYDASYRSLNYTATIMYDGDCPPDADETFKNLEHILRTSRPPKGDGNLHGNLCYINLDYSDNQGRCEPYTDIYKLKCDWKFNRELTKDDVTLYDNFFCDAIHKADCQS